MSVGEDDTTFTVFWDEPETLNGIITAYNIRFTYYENDAQVQESTTSERVITVNSTFSEFSDHCHLSFVHTCTSIMVVFTHAILWPSYHYSECFKGLAVVLSL